NVEDPCQVDGVALHLHVVRHCYLLPIAAEVSARRKRDFDRRADQLNDWCRLSIPPQKAHGPPVVCRSLSTKPRRAPVLMCSLARAHPRGRGRAASTPKDAALGREGLLNYPPATSGSGTSAACGDDVRRSA